MLDSSLPTPHLIYSYKVDKLSNSLHCFAITSNLPTEVITPQLNVLRWLSLVKACSSFELLRSADGWDTFFKLNTPAGLTKRYFGKRAQIASERDFFKFHGVVCIS